VVVVEIIVKDLQEVHTVMVEEIEMVVNVIDMVEIIY
jgi:hypothetical protein